MGQSKKDNAYLIIHGFGGSIHEIEYLAAYLKDRGFDTYTVLLAGHGKSKKELSASSYRDWIQSVKTSIDGLTGEYECINLLGFSLGGLICAHFASLEQVKRIVFINTPVYLWNVKLIVQDITHGLYHGKPEKISYYKKSVGNVSVKSGVDFLRMLNKTKKLFQAIPRPSLILQCKGDETAYYKSAEFIKGKIGRGANILYYDGGCHQVFKDAPELRDRLCGDIYKFLTS